MANYNTNFPNGIEINPEGTNKAYINSDGKAYLASDLEVGGNLKIVGTIDTTGTADNLTLTGALVVGTTTTTTGLHTANGGITVPSGKTLTLTGVTVTGLATNLTGNVTGNVTGYQNGAAVSLDCTDDVILSASQILADTFIITASGSSKSITCTGMAVGKQFTVINDADTNDVTLTMGSGTTATSTHEKTAVFIVSAAEKILKITVDV